MDDNTAKAIILSVLFGGIALAVITMVITSAVTRHFEKKRSNGLSVDEWASRLHALARALQASQAGDDRVAGAVLLEHAHLLRPGARDCGCPAESREPMRVVEEAGQF
jgi:hypothetical protein